MVDNLARGECGAGFGQHGGRVWVLRSATSLPEEDTSKLIETPISAANDVGASGGVNDGERSPLRNIGRGLGEILRGGRYTGDFGYDDVIALANANKGGDEFGYRSSS